MTQIQRAIILVSIIGTILDEYRNQDELSAPVRALKFACKRFMINQSGMREIPFIGKKITDARKYQQFAKTVMIGDKIWQKAIDRYASQSITIEATSLIRALYDFAPDLLAKYAHISSKKINDYMAEAIDGDEKCKRDGAVIGGYLTELLAEEMGIKINGRLRALRMKVQREVAA